MSRRIVVTGGGTGLGYACAERLCAESPRLHLVARRENVLADAAARLRAAGAAEVTTHPCDLTDADEVTDLARDLAGDPIEGLVLAAGGNGSGAGEGLHKVASEWRTNLEGNLMTTILTAEGLLSLMARPEGRIVAISSIAGIRGSGSYGGAKAAVHGWMWWMAGRLAKDGITVNCVAPGFVPETDFWQPRIAKDPAIFDDRVSQIPMGRPGRAAEVAEAVAYLLGPNAGWTTGQILGVNGGTVLGR
ncbi:MAG: SDR family NAD(P)-dependent oxidoreductase [Propionibacteriaceae bacterium]